VGGVGDSAANGTKTSILRRSKCAGESREERGSQRQHGGKSVVTKISQHIDGSPKEVVLQWKHSATIARLEPDLLAFSAILPGWAEFRSQIHFR
jgi:hypothetical protein